jgi:hypothetical protein
MVHRIPLAGKRGAGLFLTVSDRCAEQAAAAGPWWLATGHNGKRYAKAYVPGSPQRGRNRHILAHQFITGRRYIDHRDGDGLNCADDNLRPYERGQNGANQGPRNGRRFKGVYRNASGSWRAAITVARRQRNLGSYADPEDAARAYDAAALEAWGEFARLNFPVTPEG